MKNSIIIIPNISEHYLSGFEDCFEIIDVMFILLGFYLFLEKFAQL